MAFKKTGDAKPVQKPVGYEDLKKGKKKAVSKKEK